MERKIEASLKPIEQSIGIMSNVQKEENRFVSMSDNLKNMNALLGERTAIVQSAHEPSEKKGFKI